MLSVLFGRTKAEVPPEKLWREQGFWASRCPFSDQKILDELKSIVETWQPEPKGVESPLDTYFKGWEDTHYASYRGVDHYFNALLASVLFRIKQDGLARHNEFIPLVKSLACLSDDQAQRLSPRIEAVKSVLLPSAGKKPNPWAELVNNPQGPK